MTVPDPEEQDRRDADGSKDTDAAFADIVANWRAEPEAPSWPAEEHPCEQDPSGAGPTREEPAQEEPARSEDHFVRPEPPPLPVPGPRTLGGMLLITVGALLLIRPSVLSLGESVGFPLGLLAVAAGVGWLVLGLRDGPPPEGWDDGARL